MTTQPFIPPSLDAALAPANLARAAVKVGHYYRTQNLPGLPDGLLVTRGGEALQGALREAVLDGGFRFQPMRVYVTRKRNGGVRLETASSPLDRVVAQALFNQPGYALDRARITGRPRQAPTLIPANRFLPPSQPYIFSYWPGAYRSFRRFVRRTAQAAGDGVVVHADIQNFFPSINRERVRSLLAPWFAPDTWPLVEQYLDYHVHTPEGPRPLRAGLPIEEPISRLLGNLYLAELDRWVIDTLAVPYARYVDDLTFFLPDRRAADELVRRLEMFLPLHLGLFLNDSKLEFRPAREVARDEDADFACRLSLMDHRLFQLKQHPEQRDAVVSTLRTWLEDLPAPAVPAADEDAPGVNRRVKAARFATWRLARLHEEDLVPSIALRLNDPRTSRIAALALSKLGTRQAIMFLQAWLPVYLPGLEPFACIGLAAALAGNGHHKLLPFFAEAAATEPALRAILTASGTPAGPGHDPWTDPDPWVRRAAAMLALNHAVAQKPMPAALPAALACETDRDTRVAMHLAVSLFSGKPDATQLLTSVNENLPTNTHPVPDNPKGNEPCPR
jgi:hypothetical protein